jgi:hypothetical protein
MQAFLQGGYGEGDSIKDKILKDNRDTETLFRNMCFVVLLS